MTKRTKPEPSRGQKKLELYKLSVARSDIAIAQRTCTLVLDTVTSLSHELYQPLFHSTVIAYGRPFEGNKTTGGLPSRWSNFKEVRLREIHKKLMKTRHGLVAHSGLDVRTVDVLPSGHVPSSGMAPMSGVSLKIASYYFPQVMFVDTFDACGDLIPRLTQRINELLEELYESQGLPETPTRLDFSDGV